MGVDPTRRCLCGHGDSPGCHGHAPLTRGWTRRGAECEIPLSRKLFRVPVFANELFSLLAPGLGWWGLEEGCRQLKEWQDRFPREVPLSMAINISPKRLEQPELLTHVDRQLASFGICP